MAVATDPHRPYRLWFRAAAFYNLVWGLFAIFFPTLPFTAVGVPAPNYPALFQCIGMIVMVYGLGYWYIAKDPERYGAFVWVGLLGKIFGPIGFVYAYFTGQLPLAFGITLIFNDLIWWPAFIAFARKYAPNPLG
jgi:small multidrug resistance pump